MPPDITHNQLGLKGIWFDRVRQKYRAAIDRRRSCGRRVFLGSFDDPVEAAAAYDKAAVEEYGSGIAVNFPLNGEKALLVGFRADADVCRNGHSVKDYGKMVRRKGGALQFQCRKCNCAAVAKRKRAAKHVKT